MKKILASIVLLESILYLSAQQNNWTEIERVFGRKGSAKDDVFKITFPRYDIKLKIGDFMVEPEIAMTSWIGFIKPGKDAMGMDRNTMVMGDIVVLDQETGPVMAKFVALGLNVTAVHNHLVGEFPAIKYVHFSGMGDAVKLAESLKSILEVTSTPLNAPPIQDIKDKPDWSRVMAIIGNSGHQNGKFLQYGFPRKDKLTDNGIDLSPYAGMSTGINFQMDGNRAGVTGDFVLLADEVNPVVKALTENGITVTAIHNHMLYDNPRLFMLHFWGVNDPEKLAKGLKAALDKTNSMQ
jgi:hypothetical protein